MSSDDQHFLDLLSSITADVTDAVERRFDHAALFFRETVQSTTWIPDSMKPPKARPPPSQPTRIGLTANLGFIGTARRWVNENRAVVAALLAFFGTGGYVLYRQRKSYLRKRRARRASSGARAEIVVVAGAFSSPVARAVVHDLERRGFVVYVTTATAVEEELVKAEGKADVLPLHFDVTDELDIRRCIEHFSDTLRSSSELAFAGLVVIPDATFPAGPVQTISAETWSDVVNAKILATVATTQAFLRTICEFQSRVIFLTPSIIGALNPPFHAPESAVIGALDGFVSSLRGELATLGLPVVQIKLGSFDFGQSSQALQVAGSAGQFETLSWPRFAQAAYAKNFLSQAQRFDSAAIAVEGRRRRRGSPLREVNNAVFDALTSSRPSSVTRVGRGSVAYDILGSLAPSSLVRWMLGLKRISQSTTSPETLYRPTSDSIHWEHVEKTRDR